MVSFRDHPGVLIIDGGLATLLETKYKCDLNHKLWSTKILEEFPEIVKNAHADFIIEGHCDLIITCTYQTSIGGFEGDIPKFEKSLDAACKIGRDAIQQADRKVILAGSLGCYGTSLCHGEEYSGDYNLPEGDAALKILEEFHMPRMTYLKDKVDLYAAETIPIAAEGKLMSDLFVKVQKSGYVVFSCKSETQLCSGESIKEAVKNLTFSEYLVGVGINCTSIKHTAALVNEIKAAMDEKIKTAGVDEKIRPRILVYPNSGECYCGITKTWKEDPELGGKSFGDFGKEWFFAGATAIGGCCRVAPEQILELKRKLEQT